MKRLSRVAVSSLVLVALLCAGCGGGGGGGVVIPPGPVLAVNSINPTVFDANLATAFTILGQAFGTGNATVRFTATSGTPFNGGTSATLEVTATIASDTRMDGTTTATTIASQVTATVTVILSNNDSAQLTGFVTFNAPPAATETFITFDTIFNDPDTTPFINQGTAFTLGQDGFEATFDGNLFSVGVAALYRPGSSAAWGLNNAAGTAEINLSSPASVVTGFARGRNGSAATLTAFDVNAVPCGTFPLSDAGFQPFCFVGRIVRLELVNNNANSDAVIGEIAMRSFDVATIFNGAQGGVNLDQAAGQDVMLTYGPSQEITLDGRIISQAGFNLGGSNNAFGVQNAGTAFLTFQVPMKFVTMLARGSATANATITAFSPLGQPDVRNIPNSGFTEFVFEGEIERFELTNSTGGAFAVIGLLAMQVNTMFTRFEGTANAGQVDFDMLAGMGPVMFPLFGGVIQGDFDGLILTPGAGFTAGTSTHAFGLNDAGLASITFSSGPVGEVSGQARASAGANAALVARNGAGAEIGRFTLPTNALATFCFTGEVARIEVENNTMGATAVIAEIAAVIDITGP